MASLYIGSVGTGGDIYEIHALTNGHRFREVIESDISDPTLYLQVLKGRYQMLAGGNAIYCTAINPIIENKIEYNPHDDIEGTIHFVALDSQGEIEAALSVALDIGSTDGGYKIGLPLENRWKSGDYPVGENLDEFREKYIRLTYNENRDIVPFEMAELYRHYKKFGSNNAYARLGLYCGCNHLLIREARKKQETATTLWVFDAIPQYFNLYRYAGAAVLREFTIKDEPKFISPSKRDLSKKHNNGHKFLEYKGEKISRDVLVPIPQIEDNNLIFKKELVPFMDGVVDIRLVERAMESSLLSLSPIHFEGIAEYEKQYLTATIELLMHRAYTLAGRKIPLPKDKNGSDIVWDYGIIGL